MNIAIFTNNYLPNPFGVSMSIESFRKELESQGHAVYVFAPEFKGYIDENENVFRYPALDLTFRKIRFPIAIPFSFKMNKILKNLEIDIIHSQHPNLLGWEARRWARKKKVPLIFTWHTLYDQYAHFTPIIPDRMAAWWAIRNARKYANKADTVITPTNSVGEIIRKWGVKNKNIVAIPTGVEEKQLRGANGKKIRQKYGISENEVLLVVVTRFTSEKNVEFLFRSVVGVLKKNKHVKFLACGDGDLLDRLKEFVGESDVAGQVIFTGFVPNDLKKDCYAAGDIFVFASKSETQGMVTSEAMYFGLPVVAVLATGTRDLVANQISGLLVKEDEKKFTDAVEKLVADADLRKQLGENAQTFALKNYTSSACAQKMLKMYEEAISKKKHKNS